jgi:hypothetical protein
MFAAVPMVVVSMFLKNKVAHALSESGVPMDGSASLGDVPRSSTPGRGRRIVRRVLAGAGVVLGAFVIVGVLAEAVDEVTETSPTARRTGGTTQTAQASTSTTVAPEVSTTLAATGTTRPVFVPPPTAPPETATAQIDAIYSGGQPFARVVWTSSGGTSVLVTGPNGFAYSTPSGTQTGCFGTRERSGACTAPPTSGTYTITVRGSAGQILVQKSSTASL